MWGFLSRYLRNSRHLHLKQKPIDSLEELIDLVDRFLDDRMHYPLEWDDFISWDNSNEEIEKFRNSISRYERDLFFSRSGAENPYLSNLMKERNRLADRVGLSRRT